MIFLRRTSITVFHVVLLALIVVSCTPAKNEKALDRDAEITAIRDVLSKQEAAWNSGNIDGLMEGYWKSDSLMFVGRDVTMGWNETLSRYKKGYPDLETMGKLTFTFNDFKFIGNETCLITGRYTLQRVNDQPTGMFTLLIQKKNGQWVIVYDHTS